MEKYEGLIDNKNAEVWTIDESERLYNLAFEIIEDEEYYIVSGKSVVGYKYDFIGELISTLKKEFKDKKVYRKLLLDHLPNKFNQFKQSYIEIKEQLESNCYSNTKKGIINTAVGIVNLKSNHGWTDRTESTVNEGSIKPRKITFTKSNE